MDSTGRLRNITEGLKPAVTMVMVEIVFGGLNILYKLARNDGMSMKIFVAYRNIFAAAVMVPLALIFERNTRPKLTWMIFLQGFSCGLLGGSLGQNLYAESLSLTSATFVAAMSNLIPALTFVMAVFLRMEKLAIGTTAGRAKVVGTVTSLGGAMVLTFYKGGELKLWSININILHHGTAALQDLSNNQMLGSFLAAASCVCLAVWLIVQTKMSMVYPSYSGTALMCVSAAIQSVAYGMCTERDWSAWRLGWNIRLLTVVYSGVLASGLMVTLIAWVSRMRGPLFVSSFFPLVLVTVAILGSLLLHEQLYIGSIIAAVFITVGLYFVLWGKSKDMKQTTKVQGEKIFSDQELSHIVIESSYNSKSERKPAATGVVVPIEYTDQGSGLPSAAAVEHESYCRDSIADWR